MKQKLHYFLLLLFSRLSGWMNEKTVLNVAKIAGITAYYCISSRKNIAVSNIKRTLNTSEKHAKKLAKKSFCNTARVLIEILQGRKIQKSFLNTSISGLHHLDKTLSSGRGIILISGHIGNWETEGEILGTLGYPMYAVVKRQSNTLIDRWINKNRAALNMKPLYKSSSRKGLQRIINCLKNGNIVAFLIDQYGGGKGEKARFFGITTSTPTGPYRIAKLTKAAVHPIYMVFMKNHYHIQILPEIPVEKRENPRQERIHNTEKFISCIESIIRKHPSQWLWMHNRFKDV